MKSLTLLLLDLRFFVPDPETPDATWLGCTIYLKSSFRPWRGRRLSFQNQIRRRS